MGLTTPALPTKGNTYCAIKRTCSISNLCRTKLPVDTWIFIFVLPISMESRASWIQLILKTNNPIPVTYYPILWKTPGDRPATTYSSFRTPDEFKNPGTPRVFLLWNFSLFLRLNHLTLQQGIFVGLFSFIKALGRCNKMYKEWMRTFHRTF